MTQNINEIYVMLLTSNVILFFRKLFIISAALGFNANMCLFNNSRFKYLTFRNTFTVVTSPNVYLIAALRLSIAKLLNLNCCIKVRKKTPCKLLKSCF